MSNTHTFLKEIKVSQGGTVLIAGKGHETYQIVGHEFMPYSDVGFLREEDLVELGTSVVD